MNTYLPPRCLDKGDTIGVAAPAGQLTDISRFKSGIEVLRDMGFRTAFPDDLWPGQGYLSDSDENRSAEFNRFLHNSDIKGLICLRGGYGCLRIAGMIDLQMVTVFRKMVVGFSDITVLQNYLYAKTGLISMHGPLLTSLQDATAHALERFYLCLTGRWNSTLEVKQIEILRAGPTRTAPLMGGNLASLVSLIGTPYDFSWDGKIIFLEDINEPAYRVDRMLTQLLYAGKLRKLAGLILGDFSGISPEPHSRYHETIWTRVLEVCANSDFPIWGNFPAGHCQNNMTLPLGAPAAMHSGKARLTFPSVDVQPAI